MKLPARKLMVVIRAAAVAGNQPLPARTRGTLVPLIQGESTPGTPQTFTIALSAGDVVSGTLELLKGGAIAFEAFDPTGRRLKGVNVRRRAGHSVGVEVTCAVRTPPTTQEPGKRDWAVSTLTQT